MKRKKWLWFLGFILLLIGSICYFHPHKLSSLIAEPNTIHLVHMKSSFSDGKPNLQSQDYEFPADSEKYEQIVALIY